MKSGALKYLGFGLVTIFSLQSYAATCTARLYNHMGPDKDHAAVYIPVEDMGLPFAGSYWERKMTTDKWEDCFRFATDYAKLVGLVGKVTVIPGGLIVFHADTYTVGRFVWWWMKEDGYISMTSKEGKVDSLTDPNSPKAEDLRSSITKD